MVGRSSQAANVTNGAVIPLFTATSRFWGFPIGLATLPVVIANARAKSSIFFGRLHRAASPSTSGVPMIASVSFISSAERIPNPKITRTRS